MIKRRFFCVLAIGLLMFFALASYALPGMQQIALWIAVPTSAVLSFLAIPSRKMKPYLGIAFSLYLWIAFTALFAFDQHLAHLQLKRIFGCFLLIYATFQLSKNSKLIIWLYFVYIVFYIGMLYYANNNILVDDFDYTEGRLDNDNLNANMVAYFTFFITYTLFVLPEFAHSNLLKKSLKVLFLLSPIWSFIIAILTGSRQVLIVQLPLIVMLLYIRYLKGKSSIKKTVFLVLSVIAGVFLVSKLMLVYEGSILEQRNEMSIGDDVRMQLISDAFRVGLSHPLVGVGPGCFGYYTYHYYTFSHCNYSELFANSGILGLVLGVALLWKFISQQWKRYHMTQDKMFLSFLVFGIMYAVDNMFYVFYSQPWLMSFFFIVAGHSECYYKSISENSCNYEPEKIA